MSDISLNHYTDQATTELFNRLGAFFAFSDKQFKEQCKEDVKYVSMSGGMICPKENAHALVSGLTKIRKEAAANRERDHSKEDIIAFELSNHECYYTGDIDNAVSALSCHGYTRDDVSVVFHKQRPLQEV